MFIIRMPSREIPRSVSSDSILDVFRTGMASIAAASDITIPPLTINLLPGRSRLDRKSFRFRDVCYRLGKQINGAARQEIVNFTSNREFTVLKKVGPSIFLPGADQASPLCEVREFWMLPDLTDRVEVGPKRHEADDVCSGETLPE